MISKILQSIKCRFGWSPWRFWHSPVIVIMDIQHTKSQIIKCLSCKALFGINHNVRLILPLDDEMIKMYKSFGCDMTLVEEKYDT